MKRAIILALLVLLVACIGGIIGSVFTFQLGDVSWAGGVAGLETHENVQVEDGDDRDDEPPPALRRTSGRLSAQFCASAPRGARRLPGICATRLNPEGTNEHKTDLPIGVTHERHTTLCPQAQPRRGGEAE